MDKIITAGDRAKEMGFKTYFEYMDSVSKEVFKASISSEMTDENPVYARVDFGRWLANCGMCSGSNYVDINENFFFCTSCRNSGTGGKLRKVIFPANIKEIEKELLLHIPKKLTSIGRERDNQISQRAMNTQAMAFCSWNIGESVEDLKKQRAGFSELEERLEKEESIKLLMTKLSSEQIKELLKDK